MANIHMDVRRSRMQARQGSHHTGNNPASGRYGPVQPHAGDPQCRCRPCRLPSTVSSQRATIESYSDKNGPVANRKEWRNSFDCSMDMMPTQGTPTSEARGTPLACRRRLRFRRPVRGILRCCCQSTSKAKPSRHHGQANGKVDRTVDSALAGSSHAAISCRWQGWTHRRRQAPVGRPCLHDALHARIVERQIER